MSFVICLTPKWCQKVEKKLKEMGSNVEVLDGNGIRTKLYSDLSFSEKGKMHNRVVVEMAKLTFEKWGSYNSFIHSRKVEEVCKKRNRKVC